ncbi:MAG: AGE family epimerase/isomerase [Oscillospiraceae bacterium]|jgi:mannobiose 2-epimerase|nr:AGE family epimerase/isomerase [Oscillospiraceae bacterium]
MNIQKVARDMLDDNIIPFWQSIIDKKHGGYYGFMDINLFLDKKADKGCILNSRILWFFSEAARILKRDDVLESAKHAYEFLLKHCMDKKHGGVFWSVTYDGKPADTTKHTYNQAFAIYALATYFEASGDKKALEKAMELFDLIENRFTDSGGYGETYERTITSQEENDKLSENGIIAQRTMNTLLHVFEAYSRLYKVTGDENVAVKMRSILDTFINKVYNPRLKRQDVFFDKEWNNLIDLISYGHDIESSWLVEDGANQLDSVEDRDLRKNVSNICSALAESVYDRAFREKSLRNECLDDVEDERRIWWVQAEAVVGFLNMAKKHPTHLKYREAAEAILVFIMEKLVDKRPGSEWLSEVMPDGSNTKERRPIVEEWKCPYHNGRMCLEIINSY